MQLLTLNLVLQGDFPSATSNSLHSLSTSGSYIVAYTDSVQLLSQESQRRSGKLRCLGLHLVHFQLAMFITSPIGPLLVDAGAVLAYRKIPTILASYMQSRNLSSFMPPRSEVRMFIDFTCVIRDFSGEQLPFAHRQIVELARRHARVLRTSLYHVLLVLLHQVTWLVTL